MYEEIDPDLAKAYDPKAVAKNKRTPNFPHVDGNFDLLLKSVKKNRRPKAGNVYEFRVQVVETSNDMLIKGATYQLDYFPGASDVDFQMFWDRVTPLLMAVKGETNIGTFRAAEALGELAGICKDNELELDLPFRDRATLEPSKPNKETGINKHLNADGTPKKFRRDDFLPAAAPATPAA